jgi:hypothetical protein
MGAAAQRRSVRSGDGVRYRALRVRRLGVNSSHGSNPRKQPDDRSASDGELVGCTVFLLAAVGSAFYVIWWMLA